MSSISYRPIPPEDREQFIIHEAHAFVNDVEEARRWVNEGPIGDMRGLYVHGRLVSQMVLFPLTVMTGAVDLPLGGIAAVNTPPEERRRGYVEQMLRAACDEMRERGMALSMLYPFKTSFYRQFGWATCQERRFYTGSPELFGGFLKQQRGHFERAGEANISELNSIYTAALRGRFGPIVRDEQWWLKELLHYSGKPRYAYVWRDEEGRGRSYLLYRFEKRAEGTRMVVREIIALDPEARAQLFALLANHDSQCHDVRFYAPADAPVNMLLPNPLKCEAEPHFMLRLLDVAKALGDYRYPKHANGRVTFAVNDSWLSDNCGVFSLEASGGVGHVTRLPDDAEADVQCDVGVLAQLYARYLRPRTAAAFGLLEAHNRGALATLDALFAGLAPFSSDFF